MSPTNIELVDAPGTLCCLPFITPAMDYLTSCKYHSSIVSDQAIRLKLLFCKCCWTFCRMLTTMMRLRQSLWICSGHSTPSTMRFYGSAVPNQRHPRHSSSLVSVISDQSGTECLLPTHEVISGPFDVQCSTFGPQLFILYTAKLIELIEDEGLSPYLYADDIWVSGSCRSVTVNEFSSKVSACTCTISSWMRSIWNDLYEDIPKTLSLSTFHGKLPKSDHSDR